MTQPSKSDEFSDKVQRGSFPIQKIMLQIFGVILRENNDEFSEKGGGVTPIQKISLQILAPPEKKRNIDIRNEGGGGGQRPFGLYPKIHPIL